MFKPDFKTNSDFPEDFNDLPEDSRAAILAERVRLLHVYGQSSQHGAVEITGNRNALRVLRDAIDAALNPAGLPAIPEPEEIRTHAMTSDGEGFAVIVKLDDNPWTHPSWETRELPYSDPVARGRPDPGFTVALLKIALGKANAALFKRGGKPIPIPEG